MLCLDLLGDAGDLACASQGPGLHGFKRERCQTFVSRHRTQDFLPDATFESEKEAEKAIASPPTGSSPGDTACLCDARTPIITPLSLSGGHGHIGRMVLMLALSE